MPLIDHLSVGVPDIVKARSFYDPMIATLGIGCLASGEEFAAYGRTRLEFLLLIPFDGKPATGGNGTHIAFSARSLAEVNEFHEAAIQHGGHCEGAPGLREFYPMPDVYTAYVRDPFGNKLEVIYNGFAASAALA